jgi:hypothetical protein
VLPPWTDDLAVLLWPWRIRDGIILPPVKDTADEHGGSGGGDSGKQDDDQGR